MSKAVLRLESVLESIEDIAYILQENDLRGIAAVRNYIAHDYDSVDDHIIDDVIRFDLPRIKNTAERIVEK